LELPAVILLLVVLIAAIGAYLRSPTVKGARGERRVNSMLERQLPSKEYKVFHDVTLPTSQGPTQIDHIVVSRYGVFVVETKNYTGWIFGDAKSKQWTQTIFGYKSRFQNPLHQNFKHTKAVESFLSLSPQYVHSVVVFVGDAEFMTDLPDNVTYLPELCSFVLSFRDLLLDTSRVRAIAMMLTDHKEGREFRQEPALAAVPDEPRCPKCGERMVLRKARKGKNAGNEFWGCPRFPGCGGVRQIATVGGPTGAADRNRSGDQLDRFLTRQEK
jgi:restriction system protein